MDKLRKKMLVYEFDGEAPPSFDPINPSMMFSYDSHGREHAFMKEDIFIQSFYDKEGRLSKKVKDTVGLGKDTSMYCYYEDGELFCVRTSADYHGIVNERHELYEWNHDKAICRKVVVQMDDNDLRSWISEIRYYSPEHRLFLVVIKDDEGKLVGLDKFQYRQDGTLEQIRHTTNSREEKKVSSYTEYFNSDGESIGTIRGSKIRTTTEYTYDDEGNWIRAKVMGPEGEVIGETVRQIIYW